MNKRRKVWWIWGGCVMLLVTFGSLAFVLGSEPERLHRETRAIVHDYDFVKVQRSMPMINLVSGYMDYEFYDAEGLNDDEVAKINERLDSVCNGCSVVDSLDGNGETTFFESDSQRLWLQVAVNKNPLEDVVSIDVMLWHKNDEPNLWDRIRSWWPW